MAKGKAKAAATDAEAAKGGAAALIVFGRDEGGRAHASAFTSADQELAIRAAGVMAMRVLPVTRDEHRAVASELPAGKIFSSGKGFVPYCAEGTYRRLEAFADAYQPEPPTDPEPPVHTSVPATWADIAVGGLVLAAETPGAGYFEAVTIAAPGDDMFELRWVSWPDLPVFVRRREHLALVNEVGLVTPEMLDEGHAPAAEACEAEA